MTNTVRIGLGLILLLCGTPSMLSGCADHVKPAHLDVAAKPAVPEEDEWLQQKRLLRYRHVDSAGNTIEETTTGTFNVLSSIYAQCDPALVGGTPACQNTFKFQVQLNLCIARTALALATPQSDPFVFTLSDGTKSVYDRVTEANAVELATYASDYARWSLYNALTQLQTPTVPACRTATGSAGTWVASASDSTRPISLDFAGAAVEAYYLAVAGMERAVEATLNVSDSARSSSTSPKTAQDRAVYGAAFSRAAAAHMLVGGDDGLMGTADQGYCLAQSLTPQANSALRLLRDGAPNPALILDPMTGIQSLLNSTSLAGGSVRQRLGAFYALAPMRDSLQPVETYYGLDEKDFLQARSYLAQEIGVFGRSLTATFPLAAGYSRYAGAAGDRVTELPPGAWAARARYATGASPWYDSAYGVYFLAPHGSEPAENAGVYHSPPLNTLMGGTQATIREIMRTSTDHFAMTSATAPTPQSKEVLGVLSSLVSAEEYNGTVEIITDLAAVHADAWGSVQADKVRIVIGEEGLRCAVQGNIEGAACSDALTGAQYASPLPAPCSTKPSTLACLTLATLTSQNTTANGYGVTGYSSIARTVSTSSLLNAKTRVYFVKLKTQGLPEQPGNYALMAGTPMIANAYVSIPLLPSIEKRVAEVLAPNRKNCAIPTTNCLGKDFDARLPLEDELTSDADGVESSWKHYLALAKQAAAEADLLGNEFKNAKLNELQGAALAEQRKEEQLQAAETAFEDVQASCGTDIDGRRVVEALSSSKTKPSLDLQIDTSVTCPTCNSDSTCVSNRCVKKASRVLYNLTAVDSVAQAERLESCLDTGPATIAPFATLGDQTLCVYKSGNRVCPSDILAGAACPDVKSGTCPTVNGMLPIEAEPLNYFKNEQPAGGPENACRLFRKLRATHAAVDWAKLMISNVFHPERFVDRVGDIGFEAEYGGYFTITEAGTPRFGSGNTISGRSAGWPAVPAIDCSNPVQAGLFCSVLPTTATNGQIGAFNKRVLEAALAAAAIRTSSGYPRPIKGLNVTFPTTLDGLGLAAKPATDRCLKADATTRTIYRNNLFSQPIRLCTKDEQTTHKWLGGGTTEVGWINVDGSLAYANPFLDFNNDHEVSGMLEFHDGEIPRDYRDHALHEVFQQISFNALNDSPVANPFLYRVLMGQEGENQRWGLSIRNEDMLRLYMVEGTLPTDDGTVAGSGLIGSQAVVDGLELLCELENRHASQAVAPPSMATLSDIEQAGAYLETVSRSISDRAGMMVFADIPRLASSALGDVGPTGAFPALSGPMGDAVSALRANLVKTREAMPTIAQAMGSMGTEMKSYRTQLEITDLNKDIVNLNTMSTTLNEVTSCATTALSAENLASFGAAGAASCLNAMAQIGIALQKGAIEKEIADKQLSLIRDQFSERMSALAHTLQETALGLEETQELINGNLATIDGLRKKARVSLGKAAYLASYQSQTQGYYDRAMGSLANIAQTRYLRALKNAKLMGFFAKRAIEQRLGVRLNEMLDPLPLVDAPATWEAKFCETGGTAPEPGANDTFVAVYGEGFIGDYVTNLENLVESYRLTQNFHEGTDLAVVSLRDDVANVRAGCAMPGRNLLKASADLTNSDFWSPTFCTPVTVNSVTYPTLNCVSAGTSPDPGTMGVPVPDIAVAGLAGYQQGAPGFILRFGDGKTCAGGAVGACGWKSGSALAQVVTLSPGRYRYSWYSRDPSSANTNGRTQGIAVFRPAGGTTNLTTVNSPGTSSPFVYPQAGSGSLWARASVEFTVATRGNYEIGFGVTQAARPTYEVTVAAPMLELMPINDTGTLLPAFQPTNAAGDTLLRGCEDTQGEKFRLENWTRDCVRQCDKGFSSNCNTGPQYCYREFTFGVAQPWIQNGKLFNYSGFARGNFNYRIDSLALNFVGSAVRNCDDAKLPSTCYNAGFVPYSIDHNGPFFIRTHDGGDFQTDLFDGRIEHARGLALERYVTNPISSTDRDLLSDYFRTEFAGRPLDGNFSVKVWEEPGVDFSGIQDVQLILKYRYWTAND
jgi:hypothetical protein